MGGGRKEKGSQAWFAGSSSKRHGPEYNFINLELELELGLEIYISACILHFLKNKILYVIC